MRTFLRLLRDDNGAAAIEMAITLPVLTLFVWGIFQVGVALQAKAGMQHALGEGARYATLCVNPTTTGCNSPSDSLIVAKVNAKVFGVGVGTFGTPTVTTPSDCTNCKNLSVSFSMPMDFLFFQGPTITLTEQKRVYIAY